MTKENFNRYLKSSLITFLVTFAIVFVGDINNITLESFKDGSIVALVFVAVRAGVKGFLEFFILTFKK